MPLNMSELEITQDKLEKLLKLEIKVEELKMVNQGFSIHKFLSFFLKEIIKNKVYFYFILLVFLMSFLFPENLTNISIRYLLLFIFTTALTVTSVVSLQRSIYQRLDRVDVDLLKSSFDMQDAFIQAIIEHHSTKSGFIIEQFNSNLQAIKTRFKQQNH